MNTENRTDVALVVTSIASPNAALHALADGAVRSGIDFILIGDTRSPRDFRLDGCRFLDIAAQVETGFAFAAACPTGHYARKNVGYLEAIRSGSSVIIETDDDNFPRNRFFEPRTRLNSVPSVAGAGWTNVYRYFTDAEIWPRGLPLDAIRAPIPDFESVAVEEADCPVQQGLADDNPDVDAVYRLVLPLPQRFRDDRAVALGPGTWCPFNSQNTTWWRDTYPLMYLPSNCSFRMTDIWRSFVAQRICWENGWSLLFHGPTMWQERNEHDLMRDFADEVPGYLCNRRIVETLGALSIQPGTTAISDNLRVCYDALIGLGVVTPQEAPLLEAWLSDLDVLGVLA